MNICGVLVHCAPGEIENLEADIASIPGVEVHARAPGGRLVVTVEDSVDADAGEAVLAIHRRSGVISAALVYHSFEDLSPVQREKITPAMQAAQ